MTDDQRTSAEPLSAWLGRVHAHLPAQVPELTPGETQALLELARVAAHTSERTAAPLTTFLVGAASSQTARGHRETLIRALLADLESNS